MSTENACPRFAGFPCQTLNASGDLTRPCHPDAYRVVTNRAAIPSTAVPADTLAGERMAHETGALIIRGREYAAQARPSYGGSLGLGGLYQEANMTLSRKEIRQVGCPQCHAAPGQGCHFSGKGAAKKMRNGQSHHARMQEAQRGAFHTVLVIDEEDHPEAAQ